MLLTLVILFAGATVDCHEAGAKVTLQGRVELRSALPEETHNGRPYGFAVLSLDRPVCVLSNDFGNATASTLALVPTNGLSRAMVYSGQHVTVVGQIDRRVTASQPPEEILLFDPIITRSADH